jgi:hypothetical protein
MVSAPRKRNRFMQLIYHIYMQRLKRLKWKYLKWRGKWRRWHRLYFPSPAEVQAARLMGCYALPIAVVRSWRTGYALTFIIPAGWYRANYIEREVPLSGHGRYASFDFANRAERIAIEIDGREYHDIVADYERDEWARALGWVVYRVPAAQVNPRSKQYDGSRVRQRIIAAFE